jgi:hypothetical protein
VKLEGVPPSLSRRRPPSAALAPRALRTSGSNPGRLDRCFLNGDPIAAASGLRSAGMADGMGGCVIEISGLLPFENVDEGGVSAFTGVVAAGLALRSCSFGDGAFSGSAECWRLS